MPVEVVLCRQRRQRQRDHLAQPDCRRLRLDGHAGRQRPSFGYISCPSASMCVKFDDYSSSVAVSRDPGGGRAAWHLTEIGNSSDALSGVACRSATLCVASDGAGNVITSKNPAGGSSAWTITTIDSDYSLSVECSDAGPCIALDPRGNALTSANPAGGRSTWMRSHVDSDALTTASCPSLRLCVAADAYGKVTSAPRSAPADAGYS